MLDRCKATLSPLCSITISGVVVACEGGCQAILDLSANGQSGMVVFG